MIYRLVSKNPGIPSITLSHDASAYIYAVDSVNLLVGPSGSGKTRLMHELVYQLCGNAYEPAFHVEGHVENLAVIYYSASPFHVGIPLEDKQGAVFFDASPRMFTPRGPDFGKDGKGSGNAVLAHQYRALAQAIEMQLEYGAERIMLLIDDADMLLDVNQQRFYLTNLETALAQFKNEKPGLTVQVILAAHSPLMASDVLGECIICMGEVTAAKGGIRGFGSPIQPIYNYTFSTPSIGGVAERTIAKLQADTLKVQPGRDVIISGIDDDFIKQYLNRKNP